MSFENSNPRHYEVFTIREYIADRQQRSQWTKVGVAFENKDGSFNIRLHALPVTNLKSGLAELHMRLPRPREEQADGETASGQAGGFDYQPYSGNDESLM